MKILRPLLLALLLLPVVAFAGDDRPYMAHYVVKAKFQDVKDAVEQAITSRGIVINNVSHIGEMLARTGKDLGAKKHVYLHGQAVEFCSSTVSRETMEADPHNIVFCPYIIAIYVTPDQPDRVHLAFRRPQYVGSPASKESLRKVNELLEEIVKEAIDWFPKS